MPPTNSPITDFPEPTPPSRTPSPLIPALSNLGSPVLDLASTLTIQTSDDGDPNSASPPRSMASTAANRVPEPLQRQLQVERRRNEMLLRQHQQNLNEETRERRRHEQQMDDIRRRLEINNTLDMSNRILSSTTGGPDREPRIAYGDRIPNSQSLYDWAPAVDDREEEFEDILNELRQQQPNFNSETLTERERVPSLEPEFRYRYHSSRFLPSSQPLNHETSLRSAAILQSVRRNYRFSARSRDLVQRWSTERDRIASETLDDLERPISSRWLRERPNPNESSRYELNRLQWQAIHRLPNNAQRESESFQRHYADDNQSLRPSKFENVIKCLHAICSSSQDDEEVFAALGNEQLTREEIQSLVKKFMRSPRPIPQPPETSWLAPGISYCGYQRAHHATSQASSGTTLHRLASNQATSSTVPDDVLSSSSTNPRRPWIEQTLTTSPQPQNYPHAARYFNLSGSSLLSYDHWSVKVSIHTVDYYSMTLSATMEAYNVRQMPVSRQPYDGDISRPDPGNLNHNVVTLPASSTFLEGEIIDFNKHTLFTESYDSHPHIDATYWSKLEPFKGLKDEDLGKNLLSRSWIEEEVIGKYVLMRWKERCFIRPARPLVDTVAVEERRNWGLRNHEGQSQQLSPSAELSINGFYYISLRRKDGYCEGLYCDPKLNTPYQHVQLRPETRGKLALGSWSFR